MSVRRFKTDPDNQPRPMPGAYLVKNLLNGKCYVGISQKVSRRRAEHARGDGTAPLLTKAIRKHGLENFEFTPLFYSITGTAFLPGLETALIAAYDSLAPNGYNIQAASGAVGPYGPAFGEILRLAYAVPEVRERMISRNRATAAMPSVRARMTEIALLSHVIEAKRLNMMSLWDNGAFDHRSPPVHTPDALARAAVKQRQTKADPEWKARMSSTMSEAQRRPETKAKKSIAIRAALASPENRANRLGRFWITDGNVELKVAKGSQVPDGWRRGRNEKFRNSHSPSEMSVMAKNPRPPRRKR